MTIDEIVAVSGLPGLYKIAGSRSNGMIIEDIISGKTKFASMRKHQFTPLGTVAIYTIEDATAINTVFETIAEQEATNPPPPLNTPKPELFKYFSTILPDYDDVKKVIKWYNFLKKHNLFPFEKEAEEGSSEEE